MPVMENNNYTRAEALLDELTEGYQNKVSLSELSRKYEIRREAIVVVLTVAGVMPSNESRDRLLEYVRENKGLSIDDLALRLDMPKSTVSRYLRGTKEQTMVVIRKTTDYTTYPDAVKIKALKEAWKKLPKAKKADGLTRKFYDETVGKTKDRPSSVTFIRRWGSWSEACKQAGITSAASRREGYQQEFTNDAILDGINQFVEETGQTTFHAYAEWAKGSGAASGPLIVIRFGSWADARIAALERVDNPLVSQNGRKR